MYCFELQLFACTTYSISIFSLQPSASMVIISYLVIPLILVGAYLTFPKAIVFIFKHATSLRHSLLRESALIQADLDYQKADVDQKIQEYIATSQGHSAKLDKAFITAIEIGLSILMLVQIVTSIYFQLQV